MANKFETTLLLAMVPSQSNPDKSYAIKRGKDGVVYCSCPAWRFQKKAPADRTCKHILSLADNMKKICK